MKNNIFEISNELTIKQHLKILGRTFLNTFIILMFLSIIIFIFSDKIFIITMNYLGIAKENIVTITPFEQINTQMFLALSLSSVAILPLFIRNLHKFINPALSNKYRGKIKNYIFTISILGILGFLFGALVLSKLSLSFLLQYQTFNAMWSLNSVIKSILIMGLCGVVVMQIAPTMLILNKIGIINPEKLKKYRLFVALFLSVFAGIVTIGTDFISQIILFIPAYLSFEVGLFLSKRNNQIKLNNKQEVNNVRI